jgi:hypothetical protein
MADAIVRPSATGFALLCVAYVALAFVADGLVARWFPAFHASAYGQLTLVAWYGVGLVQLILWAGRRAAGPGDAPPPAAAVTRRAVSASLGGGIFGTVFWMFPMCVIAADWGTAAVVVAAAVVAFRVGTRAVLRAPEAYHPIATRVFLGLGALTLAVVHLRWEAWMVAYRRSGVYEPGADLPRWAMELLLAAVMLWTARSLRRGVPPPQADTAR